MPKAAGAVTIYVGMSNGAIAATRAAYEDPHAVGVLLLSGLPAVEQDDEVAALIQRGVVFRLLAGEREQYFGGLPTFKACDVNMQRPSVPCLIVTVYADGHLHSARSSVTRSRHSCRMARTLACHTPVLPLQRALATFRRLACRQAMRCHDAVSPGTVSSGECVCVST